jgi:DNA repair protein RecO (recombination protein O)
MSLIKILTAESQINQSIFTLIEKFYVLLNNENWIKKYIFWELELFKILGYDLEFKDLVDKKVVNNNYQYVAKSSLEKKVVPNFLVEKNENIEDLKILLSGLKLVGDYLEKTILKPNNLTQPISRLQFISTLR